MGEHIHGKMDVTEQEKTYAGFIKAGIGGFAQAFFKSGARS